jgi:hypothetical protein
MRSIVLGAIALCAAPLSGAEESTIGTFLYGQAAPIGAPVDARFSRLSFELERCGSIVRTHWYDADQVLLARDELEAPGGRLSRYRYWRLNVQESARITRSGAVLRIDRNADGKSRSAEMTVTEDIAVGPMMALVAERELLQLETGRRLQLNYAVPEQLGTYEFSIIRAGADAGSLREVEVAPASWLVRRFVHSVELYFDRDGGLALLRGRVLPVMGTASREEPLEVEAKVLRRETHNCSTQPGAESSFQWMQAAR